MKFIALDFETANKSRDSACAVGAVRVDLREPVDDKIHVFNEEDIFKETIYPGPVMFEFTHLHLFDHANTVFSDKFDLVYPRILEFCEGAEFIAAHNAPFDKSVMDSCCRRYKLPYIGIPFLCTLRLTRFFMKQRKANLKLVCDMLGIELDHHDPLSDAKACAKIFLHFDYRFGARRFVNRFLIR